MPTASVTIRMDEGLKRQAETIFDEMGMNMTTAMTVFAKDALDKHIKKKTGKK